MSSGGTFRELFTHNFGLKLTSLVAAIVLFSVVRGAEDAQRSVYVDVVALLPAPSSGKMLISELPDRVRLTLKGSRSQVNAIRPELLPPVQIDLTDSNLHYYYFADDEFELPGAVTITQVAPASVELQWADRMEKELPVQPLLTGAPPEGLALGAPPRAEPGEVTVVGPAAELNALRVVRTDAIDLGDVEVGAQSRRIRLERLPEHCRVIDEDRVDVRFEVVRDLAERSFPGVRVVVEGGQARDLAATRVTVNVRGVPSDVDLIDPAQVQAVVDVTGRDPGATQVPIAIRGVPGGVEVSSVEPSAINLTIEAEPATPPPTP